LGKLRSELHLVVKKSLPLARFGSFLLNVEIVVQRTVWTTAVSIRKRCALSTNATKRKLGADKPSKIRTMLEFLLERGIEVSRTKSLIEQKEPQDQGVAAFNVRKERDGSEQTIPSLPVNWPFLPDAVFAAESKLTHK
jgi:hypothetical protein